MTFKAGVSTLIKWGMTLTVLLGAFSFLVIGLSSRNSDESEVVAKKVLPAIVQIGIALPGDSKVETVGTGVVVRSDGYVLTAKHNVADAAHVFIKTIDGRVFAAGYYVADAQRDLALLKVTTEQLERVQPDAALVLVQHDLVALELGSAVEVGQKIMTFGFPAHHVVNGFTASVAQGIVSAVERVIEEPGGKKEKSEEDKEDKSIKAFEIVHAGGALELLFGGPQKAYVEHMVQFDAMANPGSSGGAVVDMNGRLIAVINSMVSSSGSNAGINFAVPISEASTILGTMTSRYTITTEALSVEEKEK
jgi:S1-C subfamily serine protease